MCDLVLAAGFVGIALLRYSTRRAGPRGDRFAAAEAVGLAIRPGIARDRDETAHEVVAVRGVLGGPTLLVVGDGRPHDACITRM
jgi:hypothetical protein